VPITPRRTPTFAEINIRWPAGRHNAAFRAPAAGREATDEATTMQRALLLLTTTCFAALAAANPAASPTAAPAKRDVGEIHQGIAKPAEVGDVKVPKATGPDARTVAEILTRRAELKDKPVVVRAKVVKFTPGILGKNWLHLQDGSGSAKDGTHDVVVTTLDEVKKGDVVTMKGVVRTERDLGSGYFYKVLVEDAKLQK
jgi:hypothetical protein